MVRFTDHPDMALDVYHRGKTRTQTQELTSIENGCINENDSWFPRLDIRLH